MTTGLWDIYAAFGYDALRILLPYEALQHAVLRMAAPCAGERVLIAGCGTGNFESIALRAVPDIEVDGVDFSVQMLARARAKFAGHANIRHQRANLCEQLPFPDGTFDLAVMCNVLYALPEREAALAEICRTLKPGGRFVVCDRQPWSTNRPILSAHLEGLRMLPPFARLTRTLRTLAAMPTLAIVGMVNNKIQQRHTDGAYRFYTTDEITGFLANLGMQVTATVPAYANQCWIVRAERDTR